MRRRGIEIHTTFAPTRLSAMYLRVADRLWRVGAPTVLGYPGFGDAPADASLRSLSDLYAALLDVLPARFHLVAQSMGNVLALRAAIEHPERVAGFVLCAVSGGLDVRALGANDGGWRDSFRQVRAVSGRTDKIEDIEKTASEAFRARPARYAREGSEGQQSGQHRWTA
jgi:pimeloyl-ACP methyl ester carboxylesterase